MSLRALIVLLGLSTLGLSTLGLSTPLYAQSPSEVPAAVRKVRPLPAGATPIATIPPHPTPSPPANSAPPAPPAVRTQPRASSPTQSKPLPSQGTSAQEDRAIESAIRAKLAKSKVGRDGFTVRVQGGVAFWDGQTGVVQHKGAATRMARTAGARQVVNNIKISEAARQQASANLEQGRRRAQVKRGDARSE